jgi:hypothetical protein
MHAHRPEPIDPAALVLPPTVTIDVTTYSIDTDR